MGCTALTENALKKALKEAFKVKRHAVLDRVRRMIERAATPTDRHSRAGVSDG